MKNFAMIIALMIFAACGEIQQVADQLSSSDSFTVQVKEQGVALSLAPVTGTTITSARWFLQREGEMIGEGLLLLNQETFIPINAPGQYWLDISVKTADGREGNAQAVFELGLREVKHLAVKVVLPPSAQGVGISIELETAPVISISLNAASPAGQSISSQIEVLRINISEGIEYPDPVTVSSIQFALSRTETLSLVGCVLQDAGSNEILLNFALQGEEQVENSYVTNVRVQGELALAPGIVKVVKLICEVHAESGDVLRAKVVSINMATTGFIVGLPVEGNFLTF